jgi:hypothetical protein
MDRVTPVTPRLVGGQAHDRNRESKRSGDSRPHFLQYVGTLKSRPHKRRAINLALAIS